MPTSVEPMTEQREPQPTQPPDTTDPDGTPVENPSG
jgi:hypothetical protein